LKLTHRSNAAGRKSYSLLKYFFVLLIVLGVALFMYKDKAVKKAAEGEEEEGGLLGLGELLLILSLACDGITGAIQVRIAVISI
jgi:UDP-galactose transporter B1